MATILEFRPQYTRSPATSGLARSSSAEIVLFPGVRYERWSDEAPSAPKSKKGGRRRDRIELED